MLPENIQKGVEAYLQDNSSIASNRLVKNKNPNNNNYKSLVPARYLNESRTELFKKSPFKNIISKSSFFKYAKLSNEFKKPHR